MDLGNDLGTGPESDWLPNPLDSKKQDTVYIPTVQRQRRPTFKIDRQSSIRNSHENRAPLDHIHQNAAWIHRDYGKYLDDRLAACDAAYALSEIFMLAASSELQFLNMMQSTVMAELERANDPYSSEQTLANLHSGRRALSRHIERLEENILAVSAGAATKWPRLSSLGPSTFATANEAAKTLLADFQYLLRRAQSLASECDRGVQVLMNSANITESRKAIAQAEGVAKLTRLAFVFVPLSFTASFFGMNFTQLGTGKLDLWIWFAVSGPVFVLSIVLMSTRVRSSVVSNMWCTRRSRMVYPDGGGKDLEMGDLANS